MFNWLRKMLLKGETYPVVDLDTYGAVNVDEDDSIPTVFFRRRKMNDNEFIRATITLDSKTLEHMKSMSNTTNKSVSKILRAAYHSQKHNFSAHPELIDVFDEDMK